MRIVSILFIGLMLSACSRGGEFYSVAPRGLMKTTGNLSIVNSAVIMGSDKTILDHVASYRSGKDCSTIREEKGRTYCREDEPNPIPDLQCYRTLGDVMCYSKSEPNSQPGDVIGNL